MAQPRIPAAANPNVIVILADDMGYSDLGCFGSEIATPTLDRMARNGVRFSQMYNGARCCPTRASLLTGLYAHQAGVGHMISDHHVGPAYQGYLRDDCVTIAEVLRQHGYATCYAGKWHASQGLPVRGNPADEPGSLRNPYPLSRGFDHFYGTLAGCGNYFNPHGLMKQDRRIVAETPDYYYTDAISEESCSMISHAVADGRPYFLHVCYTAPHWPLHAPPELIEHYRTRYRKGWDAIRTARHESLKGMGILDSRWPISPRDPKAPDFFAANESRREWEALRMAVYAAQVESMDHGIGRIMETLHATGTSDNTLVIFLSDNGGCAEFLNEDGDGTTWPGLYRHTARPGEVCTVGNIPGLAPGPATTFMSYDLPWANASNSPFRLYKHWVHEGGIATPCVVQWPVGTKTPGGVCHRACHIIDIMATCLDAAGASYPTEFANQPIPPMEGESILPLLQDCAPERQSPLFWEHEGNGAVRDGEWKLVRKHPNDWELYNMMEDRTELHDLSDRDPARQRRMIAQYQAWANRCGVLDWPIKR